MFRTRRGHKRDPTTLHDEGDAGSGARARVGDRRGVGQVGGSPGRVIGAVGSILRAVVGNGLVRERLRLLPHEQSGENLLTVTGLIEAGKLTPVLDRTSC